MNSDPIVIIGAGHSGVSAAIALRDEGFPGDIVVIGAEPHQPYNRPPLSKSYLKGGSAVEIRDDGFWQDRSIRLRLGESAAALDIDTRTVRLADGAIQPYGTLVLATGATARSIPAAAPYAVLRSLSDAKAIRRQLRPGRRLCIVGGGFIGLELACAARAHDVEVTLIEAAPRLLTRAVSTPMSDHLATLQTANGVRLALGTSVRSLRPGEVVLDSGERLPADSVVVGIGVAPNIELAAAAGLTTADGIVVDENLRTDAPGVYAIGDCALFPCAVSGRTIRLESVQNGTDQARYLAKGIAAGHFAQPYRAVPWFWTEQYGHKLMIAGCARPEDRAVLRGNPATGGFSVCRIDAAGELMAVESLDAPRDHVAARRVLANPDRAVLAPDLIADPNSPIDASTLPA
ncbi:FAD-dependent oxidoreductase [Nocardia sp. R6R-6]|uniref:FAD-dependent oxidoreductase n=1 Tax=Nocardia sp. R6R-6 TaxID=3459303 RepID=UPI00403DF7E8